MKAHEYNVNVAITEAKFRARLGFSLARGEYITGAGENSTHAGMH